MHALPHGFRDNLTPCVLNDPRIWTDLVRTKISGSKVMSKWARIQNEERSWLHTVTIRNVQYYFCSK